MNEARVRESPNLALEYISAILSFSTSPPRSSSLIDVVASIPRYLTCLKTNCNTWFLSMLCNPLGNSFFLVILAWMSFSIFSKWVHSRTVYLRNCSWHVHWISNYRRTTGCKLCSNLHQKTPNQRNAPKLVLFIDPTNQKYTWALLFL